MARVNPKLYSSNAPLLRSVKKLPKQIKHLHAVRNFMHNRRLIEIETVYHVRVDGKLVHIPLSVDSLGRVSCHAIPNYMTQSAVDMVKAVVDEFPDEFAKGAKRKGSGHGSHSKRHPD